MSKDMLGIAVRKLAMLPSETLGIVCDLLEKLADPEWVEATKKFLRKEKLDSNSTPREFKIWETVTLGIHKDIPDIRSAIEDWGMKISKWGLGMLQRTPTSQSEIELNLVKVSVAELGFKKEAKLKDIYKRARSKRFGLKLCPAEVGPQLRLQHQSQPKGEWLRIAMEPIADSNSNLDLFRVICDDDGDLWLDSGNGNPDIFWDGDVRFVFVLPK